MNEFLKAHIGKKIKVEFSGSSPLILLQVHEYGASVLTEVHDDFVVIQGDKFKEAYPISAIRFIWPSG